MQKKALLIFVLFMSVLYIIYTLFYNKTTHQIKKYIEINKSTNIIKKNISLPKTITITKKNYTKEKEAIKTIALENYYDILPLAKPDAIAGDAITVHNFYDIDKELSWFVPIYSNLEIASILIFRQYNKDDKKQLALIMDIIKKWYEYPPINQLDAEILIKDKYPNIIFNHIQGYYYLNKGKIPYYLFEGKNDEIGKLYYLVSAYDKNIIIKETRTKKTKEEIIPAGIDNDGYLFLKEKIISELNLSTSEKKQLKEDIKITNKYIKKGLMKFDKNLNIIFDKRNKKRIGIKSNIEDEKQYDNEIESIDMPKTKLEVESMEEVIE